ncbi:hypothetical protein [Magnetofaba australis]|uniref:Putative phage resistance protein n=1 Tax=Magnetofaba australis IT-1 TaxID=1434232 RepID=A0A1Y2K8B1_9PROT|nr:hypothetical protein [Magnetofaba australis]OSM06737.1 putative phage resistance protein [Magnetofaba australis IT-1]
MTLIQELIDIPERVHKGDFVLRLTEGVDHADQTLRNYVVTPQLRDCFDHAAAFIKGAVAAGSSKAAYLHGSFGSGKSHFMAVLHLLLQGNRDAKSIPELAPVAAKYGEWMESKKLLMVPYHMIGAKSLESAIFGGYVKHVRKLHPDAPLPGVYQAEGLFRDAIKLREKLGDYGFFPMINGPGKVDSEWGEMEATWTPKSFDQAIAEPPGSPLRANLVGDLVKNLFTAQAQMAHAQEEAFIPIEEGLSVLSRHAHSLGYDGLILFLDELILWLASHVANLQFVGSEIQKVIKLVESGVAGRPVPIISFVARQRDLRELVGEHMPGAQQLSFADTLKYWEGRFDQITLEDRNLPVIAQKRVLKPKSEAAKAQLASAFETSTRMREESLATLLTAEGDRAMFQQVYPFSPALVQALVALSSVLQRERTALKVMIQLLVNQRETLKLGEIVPVGDLYDAIADEAEPFTSEMRHHFENARKLYRQKLLPMLETEHGMRAEAVRELPVGDAKRNAFLADDRLVKTLLLSALVPEVDCFKGLTASRLTALNHGSVRSPIPGQETSMALRKCRAWAGKVGEIKIGEEPNNPTIAVQLTGVDIETILEKARGVDNAGARAKKIREMLFAQFGIADSDSLYGVEMAHLWRGTPRTLDIVFANVREMADEALKSDHDRWKLVIDFPFDAEGHTPQDDLAALERFRDRHRDAPSRTLCWLPTFFSREVQTDLGNLVKMEHVLASDDRFRDYANHLSEVERASARSLMDNQRSQLRQHVLNSLEGAYGVAAPQPGTLDGAHNLADHFQSLDPTFDPQPPVGANLKGAFTHLADQALAHQFPAHPLFEAEVKTSTLRKVWEETQKALQASDGRTPVEKPNRLLMRQLANPLQLGEMHETHFVLGNYWKVHFDKRIASQGGQASVHALRACCDDPKPMGLPAIAQNLLILTFAAQTNRVFLQRGGPIEPTLDNLPDEATLEQQTLPTQDQWEHAVERVGAVFGMVESDLCNAVNLVNLSKQIEALIPQHLESCHKLAKALRSRLEAFDLSAEADRRRSADAALTLLEKLKRSDANSRITVLSEWTSPTSDEALGTSLKKARDVLSALEFANWELLEMAWAVPGEKAQFNRQKIMEALTRDELIEPLGGAIKAAEKEALLLLKPPSALQAPAQPPEPSTPPSTPGRRTFKALPKTRLRGAEAKQMLTELEAELSKHPNAEMTIEVRIEGEEE